MGRALALTATGLAIAALIRLLVMMVADREAVREAGEVRQPLDYDV